MKEFREKVNNKLTVIMQREDYDYESEKIKRKKWP
jgi:hypothetical protein